MAGPTPAPKPGRSLAIIAALLILMYAGMLLLQGTKPTPKLGLDLQGGTSVTLTARLPEGENGQITKSAMDQAKQIIEDRVNGTGVAEAEVAVQGNKNIVVNIPGDELKTDLLSTALLRFRPVLQVGQAAPPSSPRRALRAAPRHPARPPAARPRPALHRARPTTGAP